MSLSEKQDYYRYGASDWRYKEPPALDLLVRAEMEAHPELENYRFIFGGVAIYRDEPAGQIVELKGDPEAVEPNMTTGIIEPRYMHGKVRQVFRHAFKDDLGRVVHTTRPDLLPKEVVSWEVSSYVMYGICRWFVEQKVSAEVAVGAGAYRKDDPNLREHVWYTIDTFESPEGLYTEPDPLYVQRLVKREHENRNENLADVVKRDRKIRLAAIQARTEREDAMKKKEWDAMFGDVLRREQKQTAYSLPTLPSR